VAKIARYSVEQREHSKNYHMNATASFSFPQLQEGVSPAGFQMHAEVAVPKSDSFKKWLKIALAAVSILWVYEQYLEQSYRGRIDQAEQELRSSTEQLNSGNPSIRAAGVKRIFDLAFKELPVEPLSSWYAPPVNLVTWLAGRRERRLLDRARTLFQDFATTPGIPVEDTKNPVSTTVLKTAVEWISKENSILGKSPQDPTLWFLYKAKLSKAYAPGTNLEAVQFSNVDLSYSTLNSSNLSRAYMEGSNLEGASLESCIFTDANLLKGNLQKAKLSFARLESANLQGANLTGAELTLARLGHADLDHAILYKATLRTSDLQETILKNADLRDANFSQANLRGTDFTGADLRGADFRFANGLKEVRSWVGAKIDGAEFPENFKP
jgi:uncharacterized protein YjbI with pentapeptide repeats